MSAAFEYEGHTDVFQDGKTDVLKTLLRDELKQEFFELVRDGYDVSIGSTKDRAYDNPESILRIYEFLDGVGKEFTREMGRFDTARHAVLQTVRFGAPAAPARDWAKSRLKKREEKAEEIRTRLMYGLPSVQGGPWHDQGGKALALGTIVDAHDLYVDAREGGVHERMSGRLHEGILSHNFGESADWLSGQTLREALLEANMRFKGGDLGKSAEAAESDLRKLEEFVTSQPEQGFKDIVAYCVDSLGIRSRKEEVRAEINRHVDESGKDEFTMMSVGCGTALPMLEVISDLKQKGKTGKLILLDQDPIALAAAEQFAEQMGIEDTLEIYCEQLFIGKGKKTRILDIQTVLKGRELDVCEDSGLREYFPDFLYRDLTKQAWDALGPDGIMTTGNMNENRAQPEFLHGMMGWPIPVQMRKMKDIADLHAESGIPKSASRFRLTQDGVYTLCFSSKKDASAK